LTFSPILNFEAIFFLDASEILSGSFLLYHVKCNSEIFKNFKVNSTETFKDFENSKRRPTCSFKVLLEQWKREKTPIDLYRIKINIKTEEILIILKK